jgi:hypothetical protein
MNTIHIHVRAGFVRPRLTGSLDTNKRKKDDHVVQPTTTAGKATAKNCEVMQMYF